MKMFKALLMVGVIGASFALGAGCAAGGVGDECDTAGKTDDCEDGTICTNASDGKNYCRTICTSDADCDAATEACNGVSGSNQKSCQPK